MNNLKREPIAIIGTACRFPKGVSNIKEFWQFLEKGHDAVDEIPKERWDWKFHFDNEMDKVGKSYVNRGSFLDDNIEAFDAAFFDISPREASILDPQQRLLLEVTFEALEDAVGNVNTLKGSNTGVYMGCFMQDNLGRQMAPGGKSQLGTYTAVSSTMTMISNRLSYSFDLQGPSFTLDTACSSSLVAIHQACRGLLAGDCNMAVTGGVSLMFRPEVMAMMCKGRFLAKDGRSKTFSAHADGYGRGEGAGIVVLKKLQNAIDDGDTIHGVILGSGINQDGNTEGITVPSKESQTALAQHVYAEADINPNDISYLEAHGTGTPVGDPIEMNAMANAVCRTPDQEPIVVGSVKSGIGHLEAAAGIAGFLKALLVVKHKQIPPQAWMDTELNPAIDFDSLRIRIADKLQPLPKAESGNAYVAINSFGYGGSNAHAVIAKAPKYNEEATSKQNQNSKNRLSLYISAASEDACLEYASIYLETLKLSNDLEAAKLCRDVANKTQLANRWVISADSVDELIEQLTLSIADSRSESISKGRTHKQQKPVFVFSGMGPQWWAMGHDLLKTEPLFASKLKEADVIFRRVSGWSILDEMMKSEEDSRILETEIAQPANFMIQMGLFELFRSWGINPSAVVGHSVGEVSSGYAAGSLSLEEAIIVSYHRSRTQAKTAGTGGMIATALTEEEAKRLIEPYDGKVSIAGINSASNTTLSGDESILDAIVIELEEKNVFARKLRVEVPYHSAGMDPILDELTSNLSMLNPKKPTIPLYSTVTGEEVSSPFFVAKYWSDNVRQPVCFQKAIDNLIEKGNEVFLEIGPHPVLSGYIKEGFVKNNHKGICLHTLKRKENEDVRLRQVLAGLWIEGVEIDFSRYLGKADRSAELPSYPWQRKIHWAETGFDKEERRGASGSHPLLGRRLPEPTPSWLSELSPALIPWLSDHKVAQSVIFPGAGYIEILLSAMKEVSIRKPKVLKKIQFYKALMITDAEDVRLKTVVSSNESCIEIFAGLGSKQGEWQLHASADLIEGSYTTPKENPVDSLKLEDFSDIPIKELYQKFNDMGLEYGETFQSVKGLKQLGKTAIINLEVTKDSQYILHPALVDGAFQSMLALLDTNAESAYLPVSIDDIKIHQLPEGKCQAILTLKSYTKRKIIADLVMLVDDKIAVEVNGIQCNAAQLAVDSFQTKLDSASYRFNWTLHSYDTHAALQKVAIVGENYPPELGDGLAELGSNDVLLFDSIEMFSEDEKVLEFEQLVLFIESKTPQEAINQSVDLVMSLQTLHAIGYTGEVVMVTSNSAGSEVRHSLDNWTTSWVSGLRRTAQNELAPMNFRQVDIDASIDGFALAMELSAEKSPDEIVLIDNERWVLQFDRINPSIYQDLHHKVTKPFTSNGKNNFELPPPFRKSIDTLAFIETDRVAPKEGQVEIEVNTVALNYKDLAKVIGVLSEDLVEHTKAGLSLGLEVAGTVVNIGKGVENYKIGDQVAITLAESGGFKRFITVNTDIWTEPFALIKPIPENFTPTESAACFVAYGTALWGLKHVAHLKKGESVLIHGAAGGVGVAAINVAKYLGATIIAAAGTDAKRDYLLSIGADYVVNSRSLNFGSEVKKITNEKGVDVVFNSVAGGVVSVSMDALAPFGRFIEIGKNDIFAGNHLNMTPFDKGISYTALDLEYLMSEQFQYFLDIMDEVWSGLEKGCFSPLPVTNFGADKITDAFSYLMKSQQIGKVCIDMTKSPSVSQFQARNSNTIVTPEKCVVITGGLGGVGLLIADWCIDQGLERLVLLSRQGASTDKAQAEVKRLESRGVFVDVFSCDVKDINSLSSVFESVEKKWVIGGVVHAAGVLDDRPFNDMDEEAIRKVAIPKIMGASHLHELTKNNEELDFFWVLSSIAAFVGNTSQVNYNLANSFMDGLIESRHASGLPGNSIQLGPVDDVGMANSNEELKQYLALLGMEAMDKNIMKGVFDRCTNWNIPVVGMILIDWPVWEYAQPKAASTFRFQRFIAEEGAGNIGSSIVESLEKLSPIERIQTVSYILAEHLAEVLQMDSNDVDIEAPLENFGIDSLTAVELQSLINRSLQAEISILSMLGGKNLVDISGELVESIQFQSLQNENSN